MAETVGAVIMVALVASHLGMWVRCRREQPAKKGAGPGAPKWEFSGSFFAFLAVTAISRFQLPASSESPMVAIPWLL
jgi:hypothetical protein